MPASARVLHPMHGQGSAWSESEGRPQPERARRGGTDETAKSRCARPQTKSVLIGPNPEFPNTERSLPALMQGTIDPVADSGQKNQAVISRKFLGAVQDGFWPALSRVSKAWVPRSRSISNWSSREGPVKGGDGTALAQVGPQPSPGCLCVSVAIGSTSQAPTPPRNGSQSSGTGAHLRPYRRCHGSCRDTSSA